MCLSTQQSADCWAADLAFDGREANCQVRNNLAASQNSNVTANQPTQEYCEETCRWCDWWCDQDGWQDGGKEDGGAHAKDGGWWTQRGVCSTPSTPQHSMASSEGPSTTHSSVDTTTDHSPEGEWKEVVSRKTKNKLSMSPPKSPMWERRPQCETGEEESTTTAQEAQGEVASQGTGQGEVSCRWRKTVSTSREVWPWWSGYWSAAE